MTAPKLPGWEKRELEQQQQAAQVSNYLNQLLAHVGGIRNQLLAPPMNDVLYAGVVPIGADGTYRASFTQAFASLMICNPTTTALTVAADTGSTTTPTIGAGVARVASKSWRLLALRGPGLVIFGTAGATVDLEVFMRPRPPAAGAWG